MRGKKYIATAIVFALSLSLTGCGEKFPDLTEEQYKQTVEYAAGLLMKYSNNGQERLIYVDAAEIEKQRAKKAKEEAEKAAASIPEPEPAPVQQVPAQIVEEPEPEEQVLTGEDLEEGDVTEVAVEEGEATEVQEQEPVEDSSVAFTDSDAIVLSSDQSQEITPDIFLSYQGYAVTNTYPESSKSYVVNSDKGKKLLVLRFDLYNGTDSAKSVNMIPQNLLFQIILNGKNIGYSSVTFLPNDLSSYSGTIDSRAHESVVVLTQISESEAKHIDSLGMIATIRGKDQKVNLK
ncbi:hypothetical protein D6855_15515 [Butyrivibrio sp. CB08]|uniref:hypothetical protein n=1 Tax=Butyrivibrio sp. CB08 TaxID=2364879 RepID=UPI000EA889CB|nr:hypothetical protein [Butyrivibrio sp. CB08]RKM56034.1 hypothetical protein D6855_15515 [Butyrivibrio sp. CB08]